MPFPQPSKTRSRVTKSILILTTLYFLKKFFGSLNNQLFRSKISKPEKQPKVIIIGLIGAGFAGICASVKLKEMGVKCENITIFERLDDVGGTWYKTTYPGLACDVQSHMFSYSFYPNPNWSQKFSPQAEIQRYMKRCAQLSLSLSLSFSRCVSLAICLGTLYVCGCVWKVLLDGLSAVLSPKLNLRECEGVHKGKFEKAPSKGPLFSNRTFFSYSRCVSV